MDYGIAFKYIEKKKSMFKSFSLLFNETFFFGCCHPLIVLGVLWMQSGSNEHNVRMFGITANSYTIHFGVFDVCRCTVDFNHIGK